MERRLAAILAADVVGYKQNSFAGSRSIEPCSGADGEATGPTRLT
jgi:hypothetical protein